MIKDAVLYALEQATLSPGRALWLGGNPAVAGCDIYTPIYDQARLLERKGHIVFSEYEKIGGSYDTVFLECPKQKDEAEGLLALALQCSAQRVMAVAANDAGGARLRRMVEAYGVPLEHLSKHHCQIVWTDNAKAADKQAVTCNLAHLALRQVEMGGQPWWSVPGLFGWDKIDPASALLMQHLPADLKGHVADFGCGYGYLSARLAERFPSIHTIDALDADARAATCCARNTPEKVHAMWCDVTALAAPRKYDAIIMNPPFHNGKEEDVELGKNFIRKAWESLKVGGRLFIVANRHLAYENIVPALKIHYEGEGYKIMTARL